MKTYEGIVKRLGKKASFYLDHVCEKITKDELHTPGKNSLDKVFGNSNRNPQVLRSLSQLYNHGNLGSTGYLSILPVDQGIEHSAIFSFYKNPDYFDPEN
ncbi:MAG: fructose-bisphosphate aldolase, partial [Flavobacteriaceae bacterium]|nr:fructose-bisphosphate aldolase [Flavobacteriaceae bacterium]